MNQLAEPAIKAILREWHPKMYRPPYTDVDKWTDSIESLCNLYGIPHVQRLRCAMGFIAEGARQALEEVAESLGAIYWDQFKALLAAFDGMQISVSIQITTDQVNTTEVFRERWERKSSSSPPLVHAHTNPSTQNSHSGRGIPSTPELRSSLAALC